DIIERVVVGDVLKRIGNALDKRLLRNRRYGMVGHRKVLVDWLVAIAARESAETPLRVCRNTNFSIGRMPRLLRRFAPAAAGDARRRAFVRLIKLVGNGYDR